MAFFMCVARVHMAIFTFLGVGLLFSIGFSLREYENVKKKVTLKQVKHKGEEKTD